jgi:hypothetical protein
MKPSWLVVVGLVFVCLSDTQNVPELLPYVSVANSSAVVITQYARFTVLTPSLLRLEYSENGVFEDRPTVAVVNRLLPVPSFTYQTTNGVLVITTSEIQMQYQIGQPFTASSLVVKSVNSSSTFTQWTPDMTNSMGRNLLGNADGDFVLLCVVCGENNTTKEEGRT